MYEYSSLVSLRSLLLNYYDIEKERERDIKMMPCFQERNKKSYFENVTLKYVSKYFKILW